MYTAKHTMLYKHKVHDGQAHVFYMDIRAGGKNYDEFVRRAIEQDGANYIRGRVSKITEENGKLIVRGADTLTGVPVTIEADMVVLAAAMRPADGIEELAQKLKVGYDEYRFLSESHPKLRPVETNSAGVFVCGACQAPKDIPEAVARLPRRRARCRCCSARRTTASRKSPRSSCRPAQPVSPVCAPVPTTHSTRRKSRRNGNLIKRTARVNSGSHGLRYLRGRLPEQSADLRAQRTAYLRYGVESG
jgi:heterodisulfide reductase subunit A